MDPAYRHDGVTRVEMNDTPEGIRGLPVIHVLYLPADSASWGRNQASRLTYDALSWLGAIMSPYPWPQLTNLHRLDSGGTEFPMVIMDGGASESLIVHETGHQWVHGILGNNEWKEGWLDEGFTSFLTNWYFEDKNAAAGNDTIDYTGSTRFAGEANTTTNRSDGWASGTFVGVEMAADGSLVAKYSNDQSQVVGTIALATFANEGALSAVSETSWVANADSGAALYNTPGVGLSGKLTTGALEGSNVDITSELVGLMTSQRNYQANSKVLSTENQMMQSLMQAL
jgi:flagellar hook protein FlgE